MPEGDVVNGESAEALLKVMDALCGRRVLRLTVDQKEHQADYDQGLNERREEEDNAHVVATALALRAVLRPLQGPWTALGHLGVAAAVHGC